MSPEVTTPERADAGMQAGEAVPAGRVLALLGLVALADLWLHHHFGIGIRNIGVPVGLAAAVGLGTRAAGYLFGGERVKSALRGLTEPVVRELRRLTTRRVVTGAAVVLGAAMLTVSSVTVVREEAGAGTAVQLTPLDRSSGRASRSLSAAATTIPVWTSPFGRLFRVDAAGYVGATIAVYPPVGRRLRLGHELPALPPVLIRPAPETLGYLADGAVLSVMRVGPEGTDTIAIDSGHVGSFMLGRAGAIGAGLVDDWERELTAGDGAPSAAGLSSTILLWKKPRQLQHDARRLRLGDTLRVEVSLGGLLVGRAQVVLEGDGLLDVALEEVTADWVGEE